MTNFEKVVCELILVNIQLGEIKTTRELSKALKELENELKEKEII